MNLTKLNNTDLISKINEIDEKINDPSATLTEIGRYISEMKTIVRHAKLIYNKTKEILDSNIKTIENKINDVTDEDEYSNEWLKFMHNPYKITQSLTFENNNNKIKLTQNLLVDETSFITFNEGEISLKLNHIKLTSNIEQLNNIKFDFSPDLIRGKNKNKRHLGPLKTLEFDLQRLRQHKQLFIEEKEKIKNNIIYHVLLYLLIKDEI